MQQQKCPSWGFHKSDVQKATLIGGWETLVDVRVVVGSDREGSKWACCWWLVWTTLFDVNNTIGRENLAAYLAVRNCRHLVEGSGLIGYTDKKSLIPAGKSDSEHLTQLAGNASPRICDNSTVFDG